MQKIIGKTSTFFQQIKKLSLIKKIILLTVILIVGYFSISKLFFDNKNQTSYQTEEVVKGNLIVTVTGSGSVASTNSSNITTSATGVVKNIYVKDGDVVKTGDKIAELDLDLEGQQKSSQAWASYQSAKNSLQTAKDNLYTVQSDLYTKWQSHFDLATNSLYENSDGTPNTPERESQTDYKVSEDNWLASEAKYKAQQKAIEQSQTSLNTAWYAYQQASPIIYAPISGTVSGLSLQIGTVINSQSSSNTSATTNKIANIKTSALPTLSINLTEIDVPKIKIDDKATITFDAFSDKTFTGKVISIDMVGSVSSGVTNYPTVILLDTNSNTILPNMGVSANIITNTKDDVLLISSSAIKTNSDGANYVQIMKNGKPIDQIIKIGLASDSQTEIISGLSEGDTVITSTTQTTSTTTQQTKSVFGSFGGGQGGNVRIQGR
ncbi:MAG: efflux RND transporter periplasmic adaptor subunit [Candidatus Roizmanbacteria bacterium]|nr:efflux RND transporter periplasmic adaptor subunit [Candidatus Roizmanbacteria bacterium]MCR4312765.1 efflux RND transporter periplasmic adaptor subunit [Candidatus Roizmanbacteria bacterium]